jgi:two-component system alkaline phosphatase synthesis response regulator PhoP
MVKILLVEDEADIAEMMQFNLEEEGYDVRVVSTGREAISTFKQERFNLVILDVMLPEVSGYDVFESIRLVNTYVPILFVTARNDRADILAGLKLGADDYITKPFDLNEFLLRVKNNLKRSDADDHPRSEEYTFAGHTFNYNTMTAKNSAGAIFELSVKEAQMLKLLLDHKNEVVSRDTILEKVWGFDVYPTTRTIDNFIVKLRKCFEGDPKKPTLIHSIRGIGYRLVD